MGRFQVQIPRRKLHWLGVEENHKLASVFDGLRSTQLKFKKKRLPAHATFDISDIPSDHSALSHGLAAE